MNILFFTVIVVETTFPEVFQPEPLLYAQLQKKYNFTITAEISSDSDLPSPYAQDEADVDWSYFDQDAFRSLGIISTEDKHFHAVGYDKKYYNISFSLIFNAEDHLKYFDSHEDELKELVTTKALINGLNFGPLLRNPTVAINQTNNCDVGENLCESMLCEEVSRSGQVECSSPCSSLNIIYWCGTGAKCVQRNKSTPHQCFYNDEFITVGTVPTDGTSITFESLQEPAFEMWKIITMVVVLAVAILITIGKLQSVTYRRNIAETNKLSRMCDQTKHSILSNCS